MKNIFLTTLGYTKDRLDMRLFSDKREKKFCYAISEAEAGAKYILSKDVIDDIVVVGPPNGINPSDEISIQLNEYDYTLDDNNVENYSEYRLFCYRMSQFVDGINIEWSDILEKGEKGRQTKIPAEKRMRILDSNKSVWATFIPTTADSEGKLPLDNVIKILTGAFSTVQKNDEVNIYMDLRGLSNADAIVLMNVMFMQKLEHGFNISGIISTKPNADHTATLISNEISKYTIQQLFAGMLSFLQYGKVTMLRDFCEMSELDDPKLTNVINSMQYIDDGISLSNLRDFETGLKMLREAINNARTNRDPENIAELVLSIIITQIMKDYGPLLKSEKPSTLDLIRWTFKKQFYQQTFTIIESKIPDELIKKGIYYYAQTDEDIEKYLVHLFKAHKSTDPGMRYKFKDLNHYFICYVNRAMSSYKLNKLEVYAHYRVGMIDRTSDDAPNAYTLVSDREKLTQLLAKYYKIAELRDFLNHAADSWGEIDYEEDEDIFQNKNKKLVNETLSGFIELYSEICAEVEGKEFEQKLVSPEKFRKFVDKHTKKVYATPLGAFSTEKLKNDVYNLEGIIEYNNNNGEIVIRIGKPEEI